MEDSHLLDPKQAPLNPSPQSSATQRVGDSINNFPKTVAGRIGTGIISRVLVEFVGTVILVLAATLEAQAPGSSGRSAFLAGVTKPFSVAITIALLVYVGGPVSGAHYNPAVSVAFWLAGERSWWGSGWQFALYVLAQCTAGLCAAWLAYGLDGYDGGLPVLHPENNVAVAWVKQCTGEVLATFLFCAFVLYAALCIKPAPTGMGLAGAIGLGAFATISAFRFVSGAVFNPAIAFSLWTVGEGIGTQQQPGTALPCFLLSELAGGVLAGALILVLRYQPARIEGEGMASAV